MPDSVSDDPRPKVRKLIQLAADLRAGQNFSITRLTSIKALCREPAVANRFVAYLAGKTVEQVAQKQDAKEKPMGEKAVRRRRLMEEALAGIHNSLPLPSVTQRERLWDVLERMEAEQNEYQQIAWGSVRLIDDADLLRVEYAVNCLLRPHEAEYWAYQAARHYAERYDSRFPSGLVPKSAPLVQDIADFFTGVLGWEPEPVATKTKGKPEVGKAGSAERKAAGNKALGKHDFTHFTHRQGQFLAFIHLYRKLHRRGPAEADLVHYFRLTPPSVHSMLVRLRESGLVTGVPGVPRDVTVAVPEEQLPELEPVGGPPW